MALARDWRDLTGGRVRGRDGCRRTVLACSGGGDSCGLVLGLAFAVPGAASLFVIAHIVHDMRPREQALADRDAAAQLAAQLNMRFVEEEVSIRQAGGNAEAAARQLRYQALARIARENSCRYIATAHHAQDQFETLLMAILRGAGPRGLGGIARSRRISGTSVRLIRPALELETAALRELCQQAQIEWREDATNADTSRLRAAIRHRIIPELEQLRPGAAHRAARAMHLVAASERVLADRVKGLVESGRQPSGFVWQRAALQRERSVVVGGIVRAAARELQGGRGQDRLGSRKVAPIVRSVRGESTDPRQFEIAPGLLLDVKANRVEFRKS